MADITAALVKDLREKSGVGMMDCKNALQETAGDIEAAMELLRKKGLSKAEKKSGRAAAEGLVAGKLSDDGKTATWSIEMNGPNNLVRAGWKRTTIKAGDKVTVTVNPLRDGRPGGWYLGITLADGRTLGGAGDPGTGGESAPSADHG